jgi:putative Holliday junction resolvase
MTNEHSLTLSYQADGRIGAIDFGTVRVGLAVTDPMGWFTKGLDTLERCELTDEETARAVIQVFSQYRLKCLLIGLPTHVGSGRKHDQLNNAETEMSQHVRRFGELLRPYLGDVPLEYVDERLSSHEAEERLKEQGVQPSKHKGLVDQMAACILLEPFLS